jgi:hypothetical protein
VGFETFVNYFVGKHSDRELVLSLALDDMVKLAPSPKVIPRKAFALVLARKHVGEVWQLESVTGSDMP